jgi:endonuclease/exonuclease/phosphatase family metal-dependent hydrolase
VVRRRLLVLSTIALVLCGCGGSGSSAAFTPATRPAPRPHPNTLRLLQLNVREGATNGRATAVAALIKDVKPDVATLDEVAYRNIFDHIASMTGMYGYWVRANDVFSVGILSRVPLHNCAPYRQKPIQHAAYSCRVRLGKQSWWIFGAHLAPGAGAEQRRAQEAAIVITEMNLHRGLPVVLAGDLNSHAPGDPDAMATTLVVPELLGAGYVDAFRELHPVAQDPGLTISAPPYGSWEARVDYVFHSKLARATSARVISSVPGHRWPSDHAALLVSLAPVVRRAH